MTRYLVLYCKRRSRSIAFKTSESSSTLSNIGLATLNIPHRFIFTIGRTLAPWKHHAFAFVDEVQRCFEYRRASGPLNAPDTVNGTNAVDLNGQSNAGMLECFASRAQGVGEERVMLLLLHAFSHPCIGDRTRSHGSTNNGRA